MSSSHEAPKADPIDDDVIQSTHRLIEAMRESRSAPEEAPSPSFEEQTPQDATSRLEDKLSEYEKEWEILATKASSSHKSDEDIRAALAKRGLFPNPPTAEEMETAETQRLARLREEAAAKKAQEPPKPPRKTVSGRSHPSIRPGVRAKPGYDKEQDPSSSKLFE
jgi:hypothetical protein